MTRQVGHRGRLGLSQVVTLGIVGQRDLDDVEGGDVGLVSLGPGHPHPHHRARGQVHHSGVLERGGEDEEVKRRSAGRRDALLAPGRTAHQARRDRSASWGSGGWRRRRRLASERSGSWARAPGPGSVSRSRRSTLVDVMVVPRFVVRVRVLGLPCRLRAADASPHATSASSCSASVATSEAGVRHARASHT